ncbi:MAG: hypothetical protein DLM64_15320 [Solirubrobacterales bacterium]|nr:MAG: hypothetical protein DLM64_15320 [Solirubrobacterales bacterium]
MEEWTRKVFLLRAAAATGALGTWGCVPWGKALADEVGRSGDELGGERQAAFAALAQTVSSSSAGAATAFAELFAALYSTCGAGDRSLVDGYLDALDRVSSQRRFAALDLPARRTLLAGAASAGPSSSLAAVSVREAIGLLGVPALAEQRAHLAVDASGATGPTDGAYDVPAPGEQASLLDLLSGPPGPLVLIAGGLARALEAAGAPITDVVGQLDAQLAALQISQLRKCVCMAPLGLSSGRVRTSVPGVIDDRALGRPCGAVASARAAGRYPDLDRLFDTQDIRRADNMSFFAETDTPYVRLFVDWFAFEQYQPYQYVGPGENAVLAEITTSTLAFLDALDQTVLAAGGQRFAPALARGGCQPPGEALKIVLASRCYPSWVNYSFQIDVRYSPRYRTGPGYMLAPPALRDDEFEIDAWRASLPDRIPSQWLPPSAGGDPSRASVTPRTVRSDPHNPHSVQSGKDARFRLPWDPRQQRFDVGPGSAWEAWITFLMARYHRDRGVWAALVAEGQAGPLKQYSRLPSPPAEAAIDYLEFVNEPNGPEGWPQRPPTSAASGFAVGSDNLLSSQVVADMFQTAQRVSQALSAKSGSGRTSPTLLGPASDDNLGPSTRLATNVKTFVGALAKTLMAGQFEPDATGAAFAWSQHNYGDIHALRSEPWTSATPVLDGYETSAASITHGILSQLGWAGLGGPANPLIFLTEGAALLNVLKTFLYPQLVPARLAPAAVLVSKYRPYRLLFEAQYARLPVTERRRISQQDYVTRQTQAAVLTRNWDVMSRVAEVVGGRARLAAGAGIAMLTQFLFYTQPPQLNFDSGLVDPPARKPSDGTVSDPAPNLSQIKRPSYAAWAGLIGHPRSSTQLP